MSGIPAGAGSLLGKRLGKYEILALLALGGTAEIYLARIGGAAGFEKYVVVKCLHDHLADDTEFVKMFLDEARLAAHLDHSNIVQTMELGEHENRYYMVMEFLAGLSLAMIVRRASERLPGGRMPVPLTLNILAQACAGLHYAHEKAMNGKPLNIVHRDISPQNLVVSFEGVVKVVDFGIAKAELRETRTRSGTIKGKFAYMSPEQCVANNVDRRTDVFALGVIAHELLTGRRLFKKNSPYETYQSVIECAVDPPSKANHELDPAIDELIMRAVAKEREARYQTAEAFGDALAGYLHHRGKGSGPGEVSRFFDASFNQEIEEHGARMRELISGREVDPLGWGEEDEKDAKRNQTADLDRGNMTVDLGPRTRPPSEEKSYSLHSMDMMDSDRPSQASLSDVMDDLAGGGGDDEIPAERTRIEANPLERLEEMNQIASKPHKIPAFATRPTQLEQAQMPPSGALQLPPPPTAPHAAARPLSGRFPEVAHMRTQIADEADAAFDQPTVLIADSDAPVDPHGRTSMDMSPPNVANGGAAPSKPPGYEYPVMDAQMREQIALGASVFPSEQGGQRPSPHEPGRPSPVPDSGPQYPRPSLPAMDQFPRAADLASPVGPSYGDNIDWAAAAATPARALPPWKLAVLFVGALGVALLVTLIISAIAS